MIAKGNQRGGGQALATHLMNSHDNERVEIADVRGTIAQDLHGALAEMLAHSKATQCKKYLYSLSINPDNKQGNLTRDQYFDFVARTEKNSISPARPGPWSSTRNRAGCIVMSSGRASTLPE
jgi:hypothetical protein